jgi:CHAT domain-containing protein/Flp pilus assembly protein TadD
MWLYVFALFTLSLSLLRASPADEPTALHEIDKDTRQAQALQKGGHTEEARKIYESLLVTLRERPATSQLGYVLNATSQIAAADGNYERAATLAQESVDVYHQVGDTKGEAHALNNKGIAEIQQGSYSAAQSDLEKALALSRSAADAENEAQVLNNLGSAYFFQGKYWEALQSYQAAMSKVDSAPNAEWTSYWRQITNFNLATLYQRLGRYEKALQIYRQVESSSKALTSGDRAHLATNLGALYRRLGDPWKALDSYRIAQTFYSKEHDADGEISVLKNMGIVYALDRGELDKAQRIFQSALSLAETTHNRREQMQSHLYLGETFWREHSVPKARSEFEQAGALAKELGTTEEEWKSLYGLGRIAQLASNPRDAEDAYRQAIAIIEKTRTQLQLSALRAEFLADKRDAYDALIGILFEKQDAAEAFSFLERSRARNFQDRVMGAAAVNPLSLVEVRSHLDRATMLLEFWVSGDRVGVIWCTRERYGMTLKQLSGQERKDIQGFLDDIPQGNQNWRDRADVLDGLLPAEFSSFSPDTRHLLIVPDSWLSSVPFDLLRAGGASTPLLIENFDIAYLPSAVLLRRPKAEDRKLNFPWVRELVAFGNPVSPQHRDTLNEASGTGDIAQALPSSGEEMESIATMTRGKKELFTGPRDLKSIFLSGKANSAFLLHVSTHAFPDLRNPENSRILFSPEHPDGTPDWVFLRELYDLDLTRVRLATISACDTEGGKMIRGEGVQAFSRALLSAGSRSSLTALWRVDDQATAEFMKQFYFFALEKRESRAEALRLAKLKFLRSNTQLEDPRFWAAFVLNGDGLTPLPYVFSRTSLILFLVGLLAVLLLLIRLRRRRRLHRQHLP